MIKYLLIIITLIALSKTEVPLCGTGWEPYETEKCFKVFENAGLITYESAEGYCSQQENASLIFIHSEEEQIFVSNFLFKTMNVIDAVWIGAKNSSISAKFKWTDNSDLSFTNWADFNPSNKTNYDCVQLMPESLPPGKWVNEPCGKKNAVVCQKLQVWSLALMQKNIQEINRKLKVLIPIGFIYVQLPKQPEPKQIWPDYMWQHISSEYSGHFFRVEGGNAAEFGTSQFDTFQGHFHDNHEYVESSIGNWYEGSGTRNTDWYTKVIKSNLSITHTLLSNGVNGEPRNASETRPINYSVRIWKRIS